ncbi:hypothetical protein [Clostridium tarantellae]|uniref:hypothetical protein n=1 Tax=Clostridium tarantellae TaxID=39493 RepID=UPI0014794EE9|nr:hypothetical protein [Clostridium tarantellae]
MSGLGYGWTTIVKVINNTDKSIKNIKFIYNSEEISVNVKNIRGRVLKMRILPFKQN